MKLLPSQRRRPPLSSQLALLVATTVAMSVTSPASAEDHDPGRAMASGPSPASVPSPEQARGWKKPPGTPPDEVALFVPRVALMLPNLALRTAFFPIQQALRVIGRNVGASDDDPTNDARTPVITLVPHFSYLSEFGATIGGAARLQNLGGYAEEAALTAGFGGPYAPFAEVAAHADRAAGSRTWVESRTRYEVRPQEVFCGVGDGFGDGRRVQTRFREERLTVLERGGVTLGEPGRLVKAGATAILERSAFGARDDAFTLERSIETAYDTRALPGFETGVQTIELQSNLTVDTRDSPAAPTRGVYAVAFAGGVPALAEYGYGHVGLDATVYVDVYGTGRVLVLRAAVEALFAEREQIPFGRLARLGGADRLRGYTRDRYRDREALLVSAEYQYPIHQVVAGAVFVDAGHVAPRLGPLINWRRWQAGAGVGLRIRTATACIASLDLAYGDGVRVSLSIFPFDSPAPGDQR